LRPLLADFVAEVCDCAVEVAARPLRDGSYHPRSSAVTLD